MQNKKPFLTAVILAAGEGRRMNSPVRKQNIEILGESVLLRSISVFDSSDLVDAVVAVVRGDEAEEPCKEEIPMLLFVIIYFGLIFIKGYKSGVHFGRAPESYVLFTVKLPCERC